MMLVFVVGGVMNKVVLKNSVGGGGGGGGGGGVRWRRIDFTSSQKVILSAY